MRRGPAAQDLKRQSHTVLLAPGLEVAGLTVSETELARIQRPFAHRGPCHFVDRHGATGRGLVEATFPVHDECVLASPNRERAAEQAEQARLEHPEQLMLHARR